MTTPEAHTANPEVADEEWARLGVERLREAYSDFPWKTLPLGNRALLERLLGFSPYVTNILVRHRDILDLFLQSPFPRPKGRRALEKEVVHGLSTIEGWREAALYLRTIKKREITKILAHDLGGERFSRTVSALTALAEALLEAALFWLKRRHEDLGPFLVFGMGKLGGRELNYSSDIDLIYFYHGPLSQKEKFVRLAQELTRLVDTLIEGERLFRVDLRLRPGGKDGELVYSLKGGLHYYFSQAHPFERLALVKARCCAGDRLLGKRFLRALRPVVYPRYLDYTYLEHLFDLKNRIAAEAARYAACDIKLGPGGIREVEFFCQALQMIYGGKFPALRTRNTLWALHRLEHVGLILPAEARALKEAYLFLRTLEHRLQTVHFRQTARLPEEPAARWRLARAMGFYGEEAILHFEETLKEHRARIQEIFAGLLAPSGAKSIWEKAARAAEALSAGEPVKEWARALGLPEGLLEDLQHLIKARGQLARKRARVLTALLPVILEEAIKHPEALGKFLSFVQRLGGRLSFFHALKHQPEAVRDLFLLFSQSAFLSNLLTEAPQAAEALFEPEPLEEEIRRAVGARSYETALSLLRLYKNETIFRLGLADLKGQLKLEELLGRLSKLALYVVSETFRVTSLRLREERHEPFPGQFVVLGLGKLGSHELGYHSDLDMVFVYQGKGNDPVVPANKLAQRLLSYLTMPLPEGPGYQVDTRLRPEGRKGPLAVSLEGFLHYYAHKADLWEKLALTRLSYVAGDQELGRKVLEGVSRVLVRGSYGPEEALEIRRMRERMEKERTQTGYLNLKVGFGGLADLEFAMQWLILKNLREVPELLGKGVLEATHLLEKQGLLDREKAALVRENYRFLRTLEQKLLLLLDKPGEEKQYLPEELAKTATYLGEDILHRYEELTGENRRLFESVLAS